MIGFTKPNRLEGVRPRRGVNRNRAWKAKGGRLGLSPNRLPQDHNNAYVRYHQLKPLLNERLPPDDSAALDLIASGGGDSKHSRSHRPNILTLSIT